jgi:hypothetical protein
LIAPVFFALSVQSGANLNAKPYRRRLCHAIMAGPQSFRPAFSLRVLLRLAPSASMSQAPV